MNSTILSRVNSMNPSVDSSPQIYFHPRGSFQPFLIRQQQSVGHPYPWYVKESLIHSIAATKLHTVQLHHVKKDLGSIPDLVYISKKKAIRVTVVDTGIIWNDTEFQQSFKSDAGFELLRFKKAKKNGGNEEFDDSAANRTTLICKPHGTWIAQLITSTYHQLQTQAKPIELVDYNIFSCPSQSINENTIMSFPNTLMQFDSNLISLPILTHSMKLALLNTTLKKKKRSSDTWIEEESIATAPMGNHGRGLLYNFHSSTSVFHVGAFHYEATYALFLHLTDTCSGVFEVVPLSNSLLKPHKAFSSRIFYISQPSSWTETSSFPNFNSLAVWKDKMVIVYEATDRLFIRLVVQYAQQLSAATVILISSSPWNQTYPTSRIPILYLTPDPQQLAWWPMLELLPLAVWVEWEFKMKEYTFPSLYSSFGPDPSLKIKPDIMVISGPFHSQFTSSFTSLSVLMGTQVGNARFTSMLAYYLQYLKQTQQRISLTNILHRAQNSAIPYVYGPEHIPPRTSMLLFLKENMQFQGLAAPVPWQGAGLVNLERMIQLPISVSPSKLELGYLSPLFSSSRPEPSLTFRNEGNVSFNIALTHLPAVALIADGTSYRMKKREVDVTLIQTNGSLIPVQPVPFASRVIHPTTFHVSPRSSLNFTFRFSEPLKVRPFTLLSGYLAIHFWRVSFSTFHSLPVSSFTSKASTVYVPYLWMYGDRSKYPCVDMSSTYLGKLKFGQLVKYNLRSAPPTLPTFRLHHLDRPFLHVHLTFPLIGMRLLLSHYPSEVTLGVVETYTSLLHEPLPMKKDLPKQGWDGCYVPWNQQGTTKLTCLTNGSYVFRLEGKLLGNEELGLHQFQVLYCSIPFRIRKSIN